MARKRYKPEEIVGMLRHAEVLHGQGMSMADAIRQLGISEVTFYRWRKEHRGMSGDQLRRLKELEKENERLRRAVFRSDAGQADPCGGGPGKLFLYSGPWGQCSSQGFSRCDFREARSSLRGQPGAAS